MKLLSVGTNAKTKKSDALGEYITAIMYLAPAKVSGNNTCKYAGECARTCLFYAGMGGFKNVQDARIAKTRFFFERPEEFKLQLVAEIRTLVRQASRAGKKLAVRLNGTSDIPWERVIPDLFAGFPEVQFYDYTKYPLDERPNLPANYRLTYSYSELSRHGDVTRYIRAGHNVAVVFSGKQLPKHSLGFPVIDGDEHDLRFQDARGVVVGLLAKGKAKKVESGFIQKAS
jgi:hypothetical protein